MEGDMNTIRRWFVHVIIVGLAANLPAWPLAAQTVPIGAADIAGVVTGPNGPEGGVWVIAETHDLPTKFVRIVVTDDQGRYLIPDLPKATYAVWVRGYGLVDSPRTQATPGKPLNLTAVPAPNPRAAAEYYPAGYWFSLMRVPDKREFAAATSTGADETHSAPAVKSQAEWLRIMKSGGCWACHQLGSKGSLELSADYLPVLDPLRNATSRVPLTVRDPNTLPAAGAQPTQASPYWGSEVLWTSKANVHNPMFDERGRVWLTSTVRPPDNPAFCKAGSSHPSAKLFPLARAGRHLAVYDPKTQKLTHISTCFSTHHLMFAEDANRTLWTSGGGPVVGWLNTKLFDETGDEEKSQGWTALILDTNGNGKRDAYVEPDQPVDPAKDKRISAGLYAVAPAPDGSIWGSSLGFPGAIVRLVPGPNPPETALAELYELPLDRSGVPVEGFSPRGGDVDRNGVYWTALASGHLASFDRRKCKGPLNGPSATGQHCPEGWSFYPEPLPQIQGVTDRGSAEASYYTWVDQFGVLGLGTNVPINTGNGSEGLLVFQEGKWIVLRVPYPLGFYTKWMDGRIDDPSAGWKGRALWATVSTRAPFHMEGGKGTTSKVLKFQLRPDPLAR